MNKSSVKTKDSKKQQQGINCDEMLNQIKNRLISIRRQDNNKNPIQLLEDLETTAIKLVERIKEFKTDETTRQLETSAEHKFFKDYAGLKRNRLDDQKKAEEQAKQAEHKMRAQRDVKHTGRVDLFRSTKPRQNKVVKKDEKPGYVKDYELYLGDIAQILLTDQSTIAHAMNSK